MTKIQHKETSDLSQRQYNIQEFKFTNYNKTFMLYIVRFIKHCTCGKQATHLPIMIYLKIQEQLYGAVVIFALESRKRYDSKLKMTQ